MIKRYVAAAVAVLAATTLVSGASATPGETPGNGWLLPDLRQAPVGCPGGYGGDPAVCVDWDVCMVEDATAPNGPCVTTGRIGAVRLRFTSSEDNVGDGPLLLYAHRDGTDVPTMTVRQAFQNSADGSVPRTFGAAQRDTTTYAYYEPARSHQHWHLMGFERYRLRTPGGQELVADRKNGFCLGDRYDSHDAVTLPGLPHRGDAVALARYLRGNMCGHHNPLARDVVLGISVGKGDDYRHDVDFQWLDITAVPSGVYDLVNTVNADRTLLETDYANNSSSVAISLRWPGGARTTPEVITAPPEVRLLRSCPGRASCASGDG
ncbi:lysyl oxidase family protein [Actinophytocola gossypii]|uniref:Lysyl oxidase n=1 Tax=Actinophytocola gossypii TaxID=2812003 RepID=A0ABT2J2B3_9PSEU|nr:lysyl oxidase family protein [Actinophytocola gossypii]MCT2582002.1 lysyl oxidase [Actinophytocola gossypii]